MADDDIKISKTYQITANGTVWLEFLSDAWLDWLGQLRIFDGRSAVAISILIDKEAAEKLIAVLQETIAAHK